MAMIRLNIGDIVTMQIGYSEVACYMKVAGKEMRVQVVSDRCVQLLNDDDSHFSFPILYGEAGMQRDQKGLYILSN